MMGGVNLIKICCSTCASVTMNAPSPTTNICILVGCACDVLMGHALVLTLVLILVRSAFPFFHPLRSQGGHNGGLQGPFCLSTTK
jgi:hypothetical protein